MLTVPGTATAIPMSVAPVWATVGGMSIPRFGIGVLLVAAVVALGRASRGSQFVGAVVAMQVLVLLEPTQDIFQPLAILRYALLSFLLVRPLAAGRLSVVGNHAKLGLFAGAFALWMLFLGLLHNTGVAAGLSSFLLHTQYVPLFVAAPFDLRWRDIAGYLYPYLFVTTVLIALGGLAEFAFVFDFTITKSASGGFVPNRVTSVFENPNMLGVYLAGMVAFLVVVLPIREDPRLPAWVIAAGMVVCVLALGLTFSRRSWGAVTIAGVFILLYYWRHRLGRLTWGVLGLTGAAVLSLRPIAVYQGLQTLIRIQKSGGRFSEQLPELVAVVSSHPGGFLIGRAAGGMTAISRDYAPSPLPVVDIYYAVLVGEYGLVGLGLYLLVFGFMLRHFLRYAADRRSCLRHRQLAIGTSLFVLTVLLMNVFGKVAITMPVAMYVWLLPGMTIAALEPELEDISADPDNPE